ncbi:Uncharacterized protein FKW44_018277, partial [Caligus rogercresseyi]
GTLTYQAKLILSSAGISVVQNVKLDLLEKISRHFRSPHPHFSGLITQSAGSRKLQVLQKSHSREKLGCTIILRGASKSTLSKVKRLIKYTALLLNNKVYEKSFLENQFPPPSTLSMSLSSHLLNQSLSGILTTGNRRKKGKSKLNLMKTPESDWGEVLANFRAGASDRPLSSESHGGPRIFNLQRQSTIKPSALPITPAQAHTHSLLLLFASIQGLSLLLHISKCGRHQLLRSQRSPLGTFLETFCFGQSAFCPNNSCSASLKDHIRRFCLDEGIINLFIQPLVSPIAPAESSGENGTAWTARSSDLSWSFNRIAPRLSAPIRFINAHYMLSKDGLVATFKYSRAKPFLTALPPNKISIAPTALQALSLLWTLRLNDLQVVGGSPLSDKYMELSLKYEDHYKEFRKGMDAVKSLMEKIEDVSIGEERRVKHRLSTRRQLIGLKQSLSDRSRVWK